MKRNWAEEEREGRNEGRKEEGRRIEALSWKSYCGNEHRAAPMLPENKQRISPRSRTSFSSTSLSGLCWFGVEFAVVVVAFQAT